MQTHSDARFGCGIRIGLGVHLDLRVHLCGSYYGKRSLINSTSYGTESIFSIFLSWILCTWCLPLSQKWMSFRVIDKLTLSFYFTFTSLFVEEKHYGWHMGSRHNVKGWALKGIRHRSVWSEKCTQTQYGFCSGKILSIMFSAHPRHIEHRSSL